MPVPITDSGQTSSDTSILATCMQAEVRNAPVSRPQDLPFSERNPNPLLKTYNHPAPHQPPKHRTRENHAVAQGGRK
eukprot:3393685-Rhodomonas_salina.1